MLEVTGIDVFYGDVQALWEASFRVEAGEIVTLIGANSAGKTAALKTVAGLLKPRRGRIVYEGADMADLPTHQLPARGLVLIPEARQLWPSMTVRENLEIGAYAKNARKHARVLARLGRLLRRPAVVSAHPAVRAGADGDGDRDPPQACPAGARERRRWRP